jgi:uncharacterized protein YndB with AHSA1/START domain
VSTFSFTVKKTFTRKAGEVFDALTKANTIQKWMGQEGSVATRKGGKVMLFGGWVNGTVTACKKPSSLSYTWKPSDWAAGTTASHVEINLLEKNGKTEVSLTHHTFPNKTESDNHKKGWFEYVFDPLEEYFLSA